MVFPISKIVPKMQAHFIDLAVPYVEASLVAMAHGSAAATATMGAKKTPDVIIFLLLPPTTMDPGSLYLLLLKIKVVPIVVAPWRGGSALQN